MVAESEFLLKFREAVINNHPMPAECKVPAMVIAALEKSCSHFFSLQNDAAHHGKPISVLDLAIACAPMIAFWLYWSGHWQRSIQDLEERCGELEEQLRNP